MTNERRKFGFFSAGSFTLFILIVLVVIIVWSGLAGYLYIYYYTKNEAAAGQLGDTFGVINSLFAGLAFAGLVYTILLQRKELKETRDEFVQQNHTLKQQRFENTFFNLLSNHNSLIDKMQIEYLKPVRAGSTIDVANGRIAFQNILH